MTRIKASIMSPEEERTRAHFAELADREARAGAADAAAFNVERNRILGAIFAARQALRAALDGFPRALLALDRFDDPAVVELLGSEARPSDQAWRAALDAVEEAKAAGAFFEEGGP